MTFKAFICIVCAAVFALCALCGCTAAPAAPAPTAPVEQPEPEPAERTLTVRVIAVEDGVVSAEVGEISASPEPPADGAPGHGFTPAPDGETVTFTIGGVSAAFASHDGSVAESDADAEAEAKPGDVQPGSILDVTLVGDETASILIHPEPSAPLDAEAADNGTAAVTILEDCTVTGETYSSENDDENALRVDGAAVSLKDVTVEKLAGGSSDTEKGDFYGMNAGLLAQNGANAVIENASVTTSAVNGNGIFSLGPNTSVTVRDSVIRTYEQCSGGIHTAGGGAMNAVNLDVITKGPSSAAIRSDRGGGVVTVEGGSYAANGSGSPAIYSTEDITVTGASLTANGSEAIVVEGGNSVKLTDCTVTGDMSGEDGDPRNIMIYRSMSGDAGEGTAYFSANGGSITSLFGDMFYVTNTSCTIELSDVLLSLSNDVLLRVSQNDDPRGWGKPGENGGACVFNASRQHLIGMIVVDEISSLELNLSDGCIFGGCINPDGQAGNVAVNLGEGCQWILTGDCHISSFEGSTDGIITNGHTVFVDGTPLKF